MSNSVSSISSVLGLFIALTACDSAPEPSKTKPAKTAKSDARKGGDPDRDPSAKPAAKADPNDVDAVSPDDPPVDPAAAFAASREGKIVEVTAKPGTPEWFVQGLEAFRSGNIDPIVANFATNIVWDAVGSPLDPPSKGKQAVQSRWEDLLTAIPDMKLHARRIFHQGDFIAMQVVLTGSHLGDFRGLAPTKKKLGAEVLTWVWHDKEGKAEKVLVYYNEAALLAQMGVLGPDAPVPAIPEIPTGKPEIITGDEDADSKKALTQLLAAGKDSSKLCQEKLCAKAYAHHEMSDGTAVKTPAEHEAREKAFYAAFPDMKVDVDQMIGFGPGWVAVTLQGKGTHKGDLGPMKATNKKVNLSYAEVVRFDDGKIAESWGYSNDLDLMAQVGLFTPPKAKKSSTPYEGPPKDDEPGDDGDDDAKDGAAKGGAAKGGGNNPG